MRPKLILVSHGHYAAQLYESAKMVMGEIDGIYAIAMLESDGLSGTISKLDAVFDQIGADAPAVIAVDMFSGTPCNVAVQAMYQRDNIRVVTGLNLSMAIEYAVSEIQDVDEMAQFLKEVGLEAVRVVEKQDLGDGEGGYED